MSQVKTGDKGKKLTWKANKRKRRKGKTMPDFLLCELQKKWEKSKTKISDSGVIIKTWARYSERDEWVKLDTNSERDEGKRVNEYAKRDDIMENKKIIRENEKKTIHLENARQGMINGSKTSRKGDDTQN